MRALKLNANIPTHHLGLYQLRQPMEHHSILTTVHPLNILLHKEPAPLLGDHSYHNCTEERDQDVQFAKCFLLILKMDVQEEALHLSLSLLGILDYIQWAMRRERIDPN